MSSVNTYHHSYHRVYYPIERGYRMEPYQLPNWIHLTITNDGGSKYLTVYSKIHVNKEVRVEPSYSSDFTDSEIIKDLSGKVFHMFLK